MDPNRWLTVGHLIRAGVAAIAEAQACVWKHVALLRRDEPKTGSLTADLRMFVADSSVFPGAPTRLLERLPPVDDLASDYVANAVIAMAFRAANEPNPRAAKWATRYAELSRWLAPDPEGATSRSKYELPTEWILPTIPEDDLTVALRDADGVDEHLARDIAAHAGRPEVADRLSTRHRPIRGIGLRYRGRQRRATRNPVSILTGTVHCVEDQSYWSRSVRESLKIFSHSCLARNRCKGNIGPINLVLVTVRL